MAISFKLLLQQIMKQVQLKISVHIHSIKLQVKFPCSIAASLRVETEELPYSQEVPLRMGEALFDQCTSHKLSLIYDSSRKAFEEKKIAVLLFLKSSSGRIPAGSVSISINSVANGISRQTVSVEKCPDKHAVVELSISCDILNQADLFSGGQTLNRQSPRSSEANKRMTFGAIGQGRGMKGSMLQQSAYRKKNQYNVTDGITPKTSKEIDTNGHEGVKTDLQKSTSGCREQIDTESHQSPHHHTEYSTRSKTNHLQRELKTFQSKYEQQNLELKNVIAKKDILERSLKENEGQLRIYREKYEDIKIQYQNLLKKNEYKDNSLKQELRTLSQKLALSETERQKMIFERNDNLNDFQERQKNLRLGLKEKEKAVNDEKIKLTKKVQKLTAQLNQLKSQQSDSSTKEKQLNKQLSQERKRLSDLQYLNSELLEDVGLLKTQLGEKKAKIIQLQEALGANVELEEEKKKFRKKIGDLELQITNQLKNNATAEANAQRYLRKCEELEDNLKQKINILKNLQRETENLNKESEIMKSTIHQQEIKLQDFTSSKQKQSQKMEGTIKELIQSQKRLQDEIKAHLSELKYKDNVINGLKEQMENDQHEIEQISKKKSQMDIQLLQEKNQITNLQYEIEQLTSAKEHLEIEKTQLEVQLDSYIQELQRLEKDRKAQSAQKQDQKRQLESKIKGLQYSIQNSSEESFFQTKELQRKLEETNKESAVKSEQIESLQSHIESLENDKAKGLILNEELTYNLKLKQNEASFLNESLQKAHQDITNSIGLNKKLQIQVDSLKNNIQELNQELEHLHLELGDVTSSGSNAKQELTNYKANNLQKVSAFLSGIKGGIIQMLPEHEESSIVQMMKQAIDRNNEFVVETEANFKQLQLEHEQLRSDYQALREELHSMQEIQEGTSQKLQETSELLTAELNKNTQLEKQKQKLELTLNNQRENTSAEGEKLRNEIVTLKETIKNLQNKCSELDRNLTVMSKQLKDLEIKSESEIEKKKKEIEAKGATILRYGDIEKQLRDSLADANKQISSLKDVNENIRKRNEKGTIKEKELEDELNILKERFSALAKKEADLQKQYNITSTELNSSKVNYTKLDSEGKKLRAELEAARNTIKMKEDLITKSQNQVKALENHKKNLENQCEESNQEIQRLNKASIDLGGIKAQLEVKIVQLGKMMEKKDQTHNLESEYLKPIRENLSYLKGYMAEYSRVGDQFESNKNKLLKMAGGRIEQYTDRNVNDKLRDISLIFQKLKAFLLTGVGLNEKQKENVVEEVKKVQSALDRSLRGDR